MRESFAGAARSDVGVQIELHAEMGGAVDAALVAGRVIGVRDRPENDAVGGTRRLWGWKPSSRRAISSSSTRLGCACGDFDHITRCRPGDSTTFVEVVS